MEASRLLDEVSQSLSEVMSGDRVMFDVERARDLLSQGSSLSVLLREEGQMRFRQDEDQNKDARKAKEDEPRLLEWLDASLEMEEALASLQLGMSWRMRGAELAPHALKTIQKAAKQARELAKKLRDVGTEVSSRKGMDPIPSTRPFTAGSDGRRAFEPRHRPESRLTPSRPRSVRFKAIVTEIDPDVDIEYEEMSQVTLGGSDYDWGSVNEGEDQDQFQYQDTDYEWGSVTDHEEGSFEEGNSEVTFTFISSLVYLFIYFLTK